MPDDFGTFIAKGVTIDERMTLRNVFFKDADGMAALKWFLFNLGYFRPVVTEKDKHRRDFALEMLNVLGVLELNALEKMVDYFKVIVEEDVMNPHQRHNIKELLNARSNEP